MSAGVAIQLDDFVSNSPSFCSAKYSSSVKSSMPRSQIHDAVFGFMFLPRIQRLAVVAKTDATLGTLRGTIKENEFAGFYAHHIRFAAGAFHFRKRLQFFRIGFQPGLHLGPHQTWVT